MPGYMFIRHAAGKVCDMITFRNDSIDPFYNLAFEEVIFESVKEDDVFYSGGIPLLWWWVAIRISAGKCRQRLYENRMSRCFGVYPAAVRFTMILGI